MSHKDMNGQPPLFYPTLFAKSLCVAIVAVLVGFALAYRAYGELALRDIIGAIISGSIATYLIHLWIGLARPSGRRDSGPRRDAGPGPGAEPD